MQPKNTFTHFFKIQKTSEVRNRKDGLSISNNAGIIYDNFAEPFYGVQSEDEGYSGTAPEKVIIARNTEETSPYKITKKYVNEKDWSSLPKVYGAHNSEGYCKTNKSVIIPLDSKLVNDEEKIAIAERIKNNMLNAITERITNNIKKHPEGIQTDFSRFLNNPKMTKGRLEEIAQCIKAME